MRTLPYLVLAAACLLSAATSPAPQFALSDTVHSLILIAGFVAMSRLVGWRRVAWALLALSMLCFLGAFGQIGELRRSQGPFFSPNYLAAFAALSIFLALLMRARWWLKAPLIAANLGSIALASGRAAMLGVVMGMFFVLPRRWRWAYLGLPLMLFAVDSMHSNWTVGPRVANWRSGWYTFAVRPLTGWGWGSPHPGIFRHFYNLELDWLVATGLLGFAIFVWAVVASYRQAARLTPKARGPMLGLLTAYLCNGLLIFDSIGAGAVLLVGLVALFDRDIADPARLIDNR